MIPIPDRHPKQVELLGSALSDLFNAKRLITAGSSFHVDYDQHGPVPKGLYSLKGLENWSGSVVSVSNNTLNPTEYDDGTGIKESVTTEKGGAVILWKNTASSTHAIEVPDASIEVHTHGGDGVRESKLRIRSDRGKDRIVTPWIEAAEKPMRYFGDAAIWEWSCGEEKEASTE